MEKNIIKLLHDWLPIIIAALSLIISIITNKKNNKQNNEYKRRMQDFEIQKEIIRQQERNTDEIFMRLNSRSNLIPHFHLILDNTKIEKLTNNNSEHMKLVIGLINIGKESASNITLYPFREGRADFLKVLYEQENSYFIYEYLNQYYALPKERVSFSIVKEIPKKDNGRISDFIEFKIRFRDLLGNLYEQRFEFGYDNYIVKGFNLKSSSGIPRFIEE